MPTLAVLAAYGVRVSGVIQHAPAFTIGPMHLFWTDGELAFQRFLLQLRRLAADLSESDPFASGSCLVDAVASLPADLEPVDWWMVRRLSTDAFLLVCARSGWACSEPELRRAVDMSHSPREFADLLSEYLRRCHARTIPDAPMKHDTRIDRAIAYIDVNCTRASLVVDEVASHVRLSRWHLTRLLVRHLGASYRDVVRRTRMAEAQRLLEHDLLSIKEVAARVGYSHATELTRAFKQSFGITPTEWRARRRADG